MQPRAVGPGAGADKRRADKAKESRKEHLVSLRKDKRRANLAKRRKLDNDNDDRADAAHSAPTTVEEVQGAAQGLRDSSLVKRVAALKAIRRIVSRDDAATEVAVSAGVVPLLVDRLQGGGAEEKLEAAWCVTNMASGPSHVTAQVAAAAPLLIVHLTGNDSVLQEQCLWALANMAGDHERGLGAALIDAGALPAMLACFASSHQAVCHCAAWALANLLRGRTDLFEQLVSAGDPLSLCATLRRLFSANPPLPSRLRVEVLWLLTYLTNSNEAVNARLCECGVLDFTGQSLAQQQAALQDAVIPSIRIVGNVASVWEQGAVAVLEHGVLPQALLACTQHQDRVVVKEACWALSNLTVGPHDKVQVFLANPDVLRGWVWLLQNANYDIKREVAYCIANLCRGGRNVETAFRAGALAGFVALLRAPDPDVVDVSLSFVEMTVELVDQGATMVEELDGVEALSELASSQHFSERATALLHEHFEEV